MSGRTVALLVAAGSGTRAGGGVPKQYRPLAGKPLIAHALDHLRHPAVDAVQLVIGAGQEALCREAVGETALPPVIGGAERRHSVVNGLDAIAAAGGAARVLIHDAARPFLPSEVIDRLVAALDESPGAVPVLPLVDTIARREAGLGPTVPRDGLVAVQTPQAFDFAAIRAAHRDWAGGEATDDAQVARAAGLEVTMVQGDRMLDKITHAADFLAAEQRLASRLIVRTGLGFDVHAFAPGNSLWLGGVEVPHVRTLKGHSDADVLLHAITDALLGATGEADIGEHFPPSDPQWRGAPSSRFLEHAAGLVSARGGIIDHIDATIICEAPKVGPYRGAIRERIAGLLRVTPERISIKATTTERLGFTGRGEGIAAQAVATVRLPE